MPRRPRPPITAREIGAFFAGSRAAKALDDVLLTYTQLEELALTYAEDDSPIAQSMELPAYVRFFIQGYETHQRLNAVK